MSKNIIVSNRLPIRISKLENSPNEIIEEFKFKLENTFTYKQLNLLKKILLNKNLNLENKNG